MKRPELSPVPDPAADQINDATLRLSVGYHMKRAFNVVQADLVATLKPFDLRMLTYTALVLIVDNPGLSQSQLAAAMDIERPNLVVLMDELERRALINRDRVPTDRRAYALTATLAGRRLYEKATAAVAVHEKRLLSGIDEATRTAVIAALHSIEIGQTGEG
ncbi:Regulatory protein, MarR [Sulfitobacter noctilucae]|uniref:MarR family winged helix-turn-helix transcriptional regulator n=1 Tax=Sulfitobacter noctilucae TaxID=1342302 RepID=UPI000468373F|nr:MarR family transcriptional regulator [Sulfitobacter noctilucae]KIN70442.1 Regulatory protein, MarR [Sulfitobacter noctilucae]